MVTDPKQQYTKSTDWFDDTKGWRSKQGGLSTISARDDRREQHGGLFVRKLSGGRGTGVPHHEDLAGHLPVLPDARRQADEVQGLELGGRALRRTAPADGVRERLPRGVLRVEARRAPGRRRRGPRRGVRRRESPRGGRVRLVRRGPEAPVGRAAGGRDEARRGRQPARRTPVPPVAHRRADGPHRLVVDRA
ncbi:hypothetical protein THAOC_08533, partial [Thalassiosira oceanica]